LKTGAQLPERSTPESPLMEPANRAANAAASNRLASPAAAEKRVSIMAFLGVSRNRQNNMLQSHAASKGGKRASKYARLQAVCSRGRIAMILATFSSFQMRSINWSAFAAPKRGAIKSRAFAATS